MFVWPIFPRLPDPKTEQFPHRLVERLRELFVEFSKVGRQVQCPPTFRRTKSGAQSIAVTTPVKVTFETAGWDTHGYWDATNNRYTPLDFTGYYRITAKASFGQQVDPVGNRKVAIYVNNAEYSSVTLTPANNLALGVMVTDLAYLNGATDYVEVFVTCGEACTIAAESYRTSIAIEYVGADQLS